MSPTISAPGLNDAPEDLPAFFFRQMLTIRLFEQRIESLRATGDVVGSVHLCNGQEGIPVGTASAIAPGDTVFATYRGHGWAIALGAPLEQLFAELLGRSDGVNAGRGGSAQLCVPSVGFMGENAIVGAPAAIALGPALAARFDGSNRISLAVFGDGAMNQGAVHEALNFAAALRLPVLFMCENNGYSELTPTADMVGNDNASDRATSYGMQSARIDGNDPTAVRDAVTAAAERARGGGGPQFIEAMTQRITGHYIGDPQTYRTAEDFRTLEQDEPIARLRRRLEKEQPGLLTAIEAAVAADVAAAAAAAQRSPLTSSATVMEHLYADHNSGLTVARG